MTANSEWNPPENTSPISESGRSKPQTITMLRNLRIITFTLVIGVVFFSIVIIALRLTAKPQPGAPHPSGFHPIVLLIIFAFCALAQLGYAKIEKPLDCADPKTLATSFQTQTLVRMALAEGAALFGVVTILVGSPWWALVVGYAIWLVGTVRALPSDAVIERAQERLSAQGCMHSLRDALLQPVSANRRRR